MKLFCAMMIVSIAASSAAFGQFGNHVQNGLQMQQRVWQAQQAQMQQMIYQRQIAQQQQRLQAQQRSLQLQAMRERNRQQAVMRQHQQELEERAREHADRMVSDPEYAEHIHKQQAANARQSLQILRILDELLQSVPATLAGGASQQDLDDLRSHEIRRHRAEQELTNARVRAAISGF